VVEAVLAVEHLVVLAQQTLAVLSGVVAVVVVVPVLTLAV